MVVRTFTSGLHDAFERVSVQQRVRSFMNKEYVWSPMPARGEDMKYRENVSDEDIIHHFKKGTRPFYNSQEVADHFEMDRSNAHRRLERLHEDGQIDKIKMSEQAVVWWYPRDAVVLTENGCDEVTAIDTSSGIASQGESRVDALKMIADAIELEQEADEDHNEESSVPDTPWIEE